MVEALTGLLAAGALIALFLTVPFTATAIEYRRRDNGLAYLLLVAGVAVWNAMFVAQLLTPDPFVQVFFLALSVIGAVLTGLGWFLFATTASGTSAWLDRSDVYALVGILGGLDIALAITAPVHTLYWDVGPAATSLGFAPITPAVGYWLHTALLVILFGTGAVLFADAWRDGTNPRIRGPMPSAVGQPSWPSSGATGSPLAGSASPHSLRPSSPLSAGFRRPGGASSLDSGSDSADTVGRSWTTGRRPTIRTPR